MLKKTKQTPIVSPAQKMNELNSIVNICMFVFIQVIVARCCTCQHILISYFNLVAFIKENEVYGKIIGN